MTGAPGSAGAGARKEQALHLFAGLPRRYDAAGAVLSFGQDPRWRRAMVAQVGAGPQDRVLDVATGTGMVAAALVRRYGCRVVGLDQSPEMLGGRRRSSAPTPSSRRGSSSFALKLSRCRSRTASSITSPSPTCFATSRTRQRHSASSPAW
ncbi:MAG: class I SAM-dependent methyltransferase [Solirubrobacterales bacterium]